MGKNAPSRKKSKYKGPQTGTRLTCSGDGKKVRVAGVSRVMGQVEGSETKKGLVWDRPLDLVRVWILFWMQWAFTGVLSEPDLPFKNIILIVG